MFTESEFAMIVNALRFYCTLAKNPADERQLLDKILALIPPAAMQQKKTEN